MASARQAIVGGVVWQSETQSWQRRDIVVEADRIAQVVAAGSVIQGADVVDVDGMLVLPGLINAHTHGHNNLLKGTGDCRWLESHINAMTAVASWSPDDLYVSTMLGIIEMLRSGTTCAYDMVRAPSQDHVAAAAQAYTDAGMRVVLAPAITDMPFVDSVPGLAADLAPAVVEDARRARPPSTEKCLSFAQDCLERYGTETDSLVRIAVAPLIADVCSDELIRQAAVLARSYGALTHMHLLESKYQAMNGMLRSGGLGWGEHLDALEYLGENTTFAHGVWLQDSEVDLLAARRVTVAHNPASNLKLGSGLAPAGLYKAKGMNVALATDGAASGDTLDMFTAMWLSAMVSHSRSPEVSEWLSATDVFDMATSAGARAIGLEGALGQLSVGAVADIVVLDPRSARLTPLNDPMTQLVYCNAGDLVERSMVAGRWVLADGRLVNVNEERLLEQANEAASRLKTAAPLRGHQAIVQRSLDRLQGSILAADFPINRFTKS